MQTGIHAGMEKVTFVIFENDNVHWAGGRIPVKLSL